MTISLPAKEILKVYRVINETRNKKIESKTLTTSRTVARKYLATVKLQMLSMTNFVEQVPVLSKIVKKL